MKIGFIHDWIVSIWWAEKVFFDMIKDEKIKQAEIFTVFSDKKYIEINWKKIKINALISSNFIIKKIWYRNLMPIFPLLVKVLSKKIKKYNPDKIIISSFAISKNISFDWYKKLYLHSPMQYIRDSYEEYIEKFNSITKWIYKFVSKYLRKWDKKFTNFDEIYFNSDYTKQLAKKIYWMDWKINYPKIDSEFIKKTVSKTTENYYIYIWRLVKFSKDVDKIIRLFNKTKDNLLIVWDGPDREYLQSIAENNILFIGYLNQEDKDSKNNLIKLLSKSRGLINITKESFGIVSAEALSLWVPIFGYNQWWSKELVDKNSWFLIEKKDENTILEGFENFKKQSFDKQKIKNGFLKKYNKN